MAPPTYFIIYFLPECSQEAAEFIVQSLAAGQHHGGAELLLHQEPIDEKNPHLVVHVSATEKRIFELAEEIGLKKRDVDGIMRDFKSSDAKKFPQSGLVGPLVLSEIQRCVLFAMESVHFDADSKFLPGHEKRQIMKRSPVLFAYREAELIDTFPVHDDENLDRCFKRWIKGPLLSPPIDDIRDYFGESVAFYFSFLSFYTVFLIPIAAFGIIQFLLDRLLGFDVLYANLFFSCLNLISVAVFLELWKRRSTSHSYDWGTSGKLRHKKARPEFRGEFGINPITGKDEVQYPFRKTVQKVVFLSLPVTLFCLIGAFALMILSFEADRATIEYLRDPVSGEIPQDLISQALLNVPTVLYSIMIYVLNSKYLYLAHYLSEWENHRTQEQYEKHVVFKLVTFEFVNTFMSLFYIAFYLQDVQALKSQIFVMLIVTQLLNQVQETVLPTVLHRRGTRKLMKKIQKTFGHRVARLEQVKNIEILENDAPQIAMSNFSLKLDPIESNFDDFMETWLQFGHVSLFSSVYPLAGLLALVNNLIELRSDAYKYCRLCRKPIPYGVRDIGAWYGAFLVTSVMSITTNCILLAMDKDLRAFAPEMNSTTWVLLFVAVERIFFLIVLAIDLAIPDVARRVKDAMDRDDFMIKRELEQKKKN